MEKEAQRARRRILTALGVFLLLTALLGTLAIRSELRHHFSAERWGKYPERRAKMTADLLNRYELGGMTAAEVTALLGENDNDLGYFNRENRFVYYLGSERTVIDSEWLLLDFEQGRVTAVSITID